MKRADGREVLVTLALPLPLGFVSKLLRAVCEQAEAYGYTDVCMDTDNTQQISALPPVRT